MLRRDSLLRQGGAGIRTQVEELARVTKRVDGCGAHGGRPGCRLSGAASGCSSDSFWLVESKVVGGLRRAGKFRWLEQKVAEQTEQRYSGIVEHGGWT